MAEVLNRLVIRVYKLATAAGSTNPEGLHMMLAGGIGGDWDWQHAAKQGGPRDRAHPGMGSCSQIIRMAFWIQTHRKFKQIKEGNLTRRTGAWIAI